MSGVFPAWVMCSQTSDSTVQALGVNLAHVEASIVTNQQLLQGGI